MGDGTRLRRRTRIAAGILALMSACMIPVGLRPPASNGWLTVVSEALFATIMAYAALVGESPAIPEDPTRSKKRLDFLLGPPKEHPMPDGPEHAQSSPASTHPKTVDADSEEMFLQLRQQLERSPPQPLDPGATKLPQLVKLICLFVRNQSLHGLFFKGVQSCPDDPQYISFLGSVSAATKTTPLDAALRRAEEQTGIPADRMAVLGMLNEYVMAPPRHKSWLFSLFLRTLSPPIDVISMIALPSHTSGVRVANFLVAIPESALNESPSMNPKAVEVPLAKLVERTVRGSDESSANGAQREVSRYDYGAFRIAGRTARSLHALLLHLRSLPASEISFYS